MKAKQLQKRDQFAVFSGSIQIDRGKTKRVGERKKTPHFNLLGLQNDMKSTSKSMRCNEMPQPQLSDLFLSPFIVSILKVKVFLSLNMFIDYHCKTRHIDHYEYSTVDN